RTVHRDPAAPRRPVPARVDGVAPSDVARCPVRRPGARPASPAGQARAPRQGRRGCGAEGGAGGGGRGVTSEPRAPARPCPWHELPPRRAMALAYPTLVQLLGGSFHQDRLLEGERTDDILAEMVREASTDQLREALRALHALLGR